MTGARGIPAGPPDSAPTPQNTPAAHLSVSQFSKPQVPDTIGENDDEDDSSPTDDAVAVRQAAQLASNPVLASIVQSRLNGLVGRSSGYIERLPAAIRSRVDGLQGIQVEHAKIEAEFQKDVLELEKRYAERYRPLYERRHAIVTGQAEPTDAEVEAGLKSEQDDEIDDDEDTEKELRKPATAEEIAAAPKGIPAFWFTALSNHLGISDLITERDEGALKHLLDIQCSYLTDRPGFKLKFTFDSGAKEYFENEVLEKTYYYQDEVGYGGDFLYERAEGTEIRWKEGKDLTVKIESKKQRNKNTNQTRVVKKVVPTESFFTFFKPPVPPSDDDDLDDNEQDDIEQKLELDYQIGEDIKERIVPRAIDFFTGKALRYEDGGDDELSDEFEDESDEDDDDDDDDQHGRSVVRKPKKALQPPASGVTPASAAQPSECQQQ